MHKLKTPSTSPEFNRLTGRGKLIYSRHHIYYYYFLIFFDYWWWWCCYGSYLKVPVRITPHSRRLCICPENIDALKTWMYNCITLLHFIQGIFPYRCTDAGQKIPLSHWGDKSVMALRGAGQCCADAECGGQARAVQRIPHGCRTQPAGGEVALTPHHSLHWLCVLVFI